MRTSVVCEGDYWHGSISLYAGRASRVEFEKVIGDSGCDIASSGNANLVIKNFEAKQIRLVASPASNIMIDLVKATEMNLETVDDGEIDIRKCKMDRLHTEGVTKNIQFETQVVKTEVKDSPQK